MDTQRLHTAIQMVACFTTIEIIRAYGGRYIADIDVSVNESANAAFGRYLSLHQEELGIELVEDNKPDFDDNGRPTTTAVWRII